MTRAVIYCRCSTEEESQRDALVRQAAEAEECVRRLNWFLEDKYIESRSGTSTKGREQYRRLFEDLLKDKFDIVVIKSQDRLMRNTKDWYLFADRLVTCKKRLYLYLEKRFYSADDALITGIKAILAEEYSRELSRKINHAHRNRQQSGSALMLTSATYGYRKMPDKSLALIPEEAEVKKKMYKLCADGYGSRRIAGILREEGIRKRNGNCFSDSDIRRMIRNPINKGTVVMNRRHYDFDTRQTVKNPEEELYIFEKRIPAIVSDELWEAANREIDKRITKKKGVNGGKRIFSQKLVCGLCGAPFYRTSRKRKKGMLCQWKCRTYLEQGKKKSQKTGGCDNISLEEDALFLLLEKAWEKPDEEKREKLTAGEALIYKKIMEILKISLTRQHVLEQEHFNQMKDKIKKQQQLLLDKYLEGMILEELYEKKEKELENDLIRMENSEKECVTETKETKADKQPDVSGENNIEERLEKIGQYLQEKRIVSRAYLMRKLERVKEIVVYPDRICVVTYEKKRTDIPLDR